MVENAYRHLSDPEHPVAYADQPRVIVNAARQVARIAIGWRLRAVAEPIIVCTHAQTPQAILAPKQIGEYDLQRCEELGATLAAGLALGIY